MHRFRMSCPQGAHKAHTRRPQGAHNCVFLPVCLHRFRELDFEFVRGETQLAAARRFHVHVLAQTLARTQTHAQTHVVCFTRTNARTYTNTRTCFFVSLRLLMRATNPCALMWFPLRCCSNLSTAHVFNKFLKDVPPRGHELAFSLAFTACPRAFDPLPGEFPLDIGPHSSVPGSRLEDPRAA